MDLIYTDANRVDLGVIPAYAFDLSFGASENDFAITVGKGETEIVPFSLAYIEGTEYGGMVDGMKTSTRSETVTYTGRTWHGILNSKVIQPNTGESHLVLSGDANQVLSMLLSRLGLYDLFSVPATFSGVNIPGYQFPRFCRAYDGVRAMLSKHGAKLKVEWNAETKKVRLSAVPLVDYSTDPVDGDTATLSVERHEAKVNHLICLGRGELSEREVLHLYADQNGNIGETQFYTGVDEVVDIYENTAVASVEELRSGGVARFEELRNTDKAEMDLMETKTPLYDIGDIVGATDIVSNISISAPVTQKIVKIENGAIRTEYKTGG